MQAILIILLSVSVVINVILLILIYRAYEKINSMANEIKMTRAIIDRKNNNDRI